MGRGSRVSTISQKALAGEDLEDFPPYPASMIISGDPQHKAGGNVRCSIHAGVYQSSPAKLALEDYPSDELMFVLSGSVTVTEKDGGSTTYYPGDAFILHKGFEGTFEMRGPFRKLAAAAAASGEGVEWLAKQR